MGVGMSYGITAETGNNIQTKGLSFYVDANYNTNADLNTDGELNVLDIVQVVNIILAN